MSVHCLFCGHPENWCEGKEYEFDDTCALIVAPDGDSPKKKRLIEYYAHARCIRKVLKMGQTKLLDNGEVLDFEELEEFTKSCKESE